MAWLTDKFKYLLFFVFIGSFAFGVCLVSAEIVDNIRHGSQFTVDGWIPYKDRVDKEKYYLPKGEDPKRYIRNFDPSSRRHQRIIASSNKRTN